jgi:hypothetical protein
MLEFVLPLSAYDTAYDGGRSLIVHQVFGLSASLLNFLLRRWFIEINFVAWL